MSMEVINLDNNIDNNLGLDLDNLLEVDITQTGGTNSNTSVISDGAISPVRSNTDRSTNCPKRT